MMRNIEAIYLSKLGRFADALENGAVKCGGPRGAFADILASVEARMGLPVNGAAADVFDASVYTAYTGGAAAPRGDIDAAIENAARATGMEPALIRAVIQTESSFRPDAVSSAGAQGLMQLMPGTARSLGVDDSFDARQNVMGGTTYLKKQLDRFGDLRLALAAYNTGPRRVANLGITDVSDAAQYERIPARVRRYVDRVLGYYDQYAAKGDAYLV